jgi:hypothetical protein
MADTPRASPLSVDAVQWQRRTNVWREVTSPARGPERPRSGTAILSLARAILPDALSGSRSRTASRSWKRPNSTQSQMKLFLTIWAAALIAVAAILSLKAIPTTEAVAQSPPPPAGSTAAYQRQGCLILVKALRSGKPNCTPEVIADVAKGDQPMTCFFAASKLHNRSTALAGDATDLADGFALLNTPTGDRIGVACFMVTQGINEAEAERRFGNVKRTMNRLGLN